MSAASLLTPLLPGIAARAASLDDAAAFPTEDVADLARAGLPATPLPRTLGGAGLGTEAGSWRDTLAVLRALGSANLAVGRLFEAHVNALHLVCRYATPAQQGHAAEIARSGGLFGLWVTDAPGRTLALQGGMLSGAKGPASGAGHLRHALVTVTQPGGLVRMALLALAGHEPIEPASARLQGMRSASNGTVVLDGTTLPDAALFGEPGDYLREPSLSTGAWRTMAVTLGGLDALVGHVRDHLRARRQTDAPLQQERFGLILIARQAAELWTARAAEIAECGTLPIADQVAEVNLARIAMEAASLDAIRHAQRSMGLAAFLQPTAPERLMRDLATYLRQPAPDMVLTEAASHHLLP